MNSVRHLVDEHVFELTSMRKDYLIAFDPENEVENQLDRYLDDWVSLFVRFPIWAKIDEVR